IARALAAQGATVFVNDIVPERAAETVAQITGAGGTASVAPFDVTDYAEVTAAVADIGTVDILVNNAGNGGAEGMGLVQFRDREPARAGHDAAGHRRRDRGVGEADSRAPHRHARRRRRRLRLPRI